MSLFEIDNVSYSYAGRHIALSGVSMNIEAGERIALLGPNGSGKSTLLRMLDGLIFASSGSVRFKGRELSEEILRGKSNTFFRSRVSLLFQNPEMQLFSPTVYEDIMFGPAQLSLPDDEIIRRVESAISLLRIDSLRDRAPHELSIGEKKRVAIAGILALNPRVMLLDEPTAGLDPRSCRNLMDIVHDAYEAGRTIVTATHDLHFVRELADTVYVFGEDKRIIASGPVKEILNDVEKLREWNLEHAHRHTHDGASHEHVHDHEHFHAHEPGEPEHGHSHGG